MVTKHDKNPQFQIFQTHLKINRCELVHSCLKTGMDGTLLCDYKVQRQLPQQPKDNFSKLLSIRKLTSNECASLVNMMF